MLKLGIRGIAEHSVGLGAIGGLTKAGSAGYEGRSTERRGTLTIIRRSYLPQCGESLLRRLIRTVGRILRIHCVRNRIRKVLLRGRVSRLLERGVHAGLIHLGTERGELRLHARDRILCGLLRVLRVRHVLIRYVICKARGHQRHTQRSRRECRYPARCVRSHAHFTPWDINASRRVGLTRRTSMSRIYNKIATIGTLLDKFPTCNSVLILLSCHIAYTGGVDVSSGPAHAPRNTPHPAKIGHMALPRAQRSVRVWA